MDLQLPSAEWLLQLWPLALMAVVVGWFARRGTQRRVQAQLDANTQAAARQGLGYTGPAADGDGLDEGTHHYEGTTRGLAWTAEVLVLAGQHHVEPDRTPMGRVPYTRWTAPGCVNADGVLALLNLPPGVVVPTLSPRGTGLSKGLQDRAGALALQAWLRLSFGGERLQGLDLGPAQALALPPLPTEPADAAPHGDAAVAAGFEAAFAAYGSSALLPRLTPAARAWLMRARMRKLSLLWDARGLTLFWPSGAATTEHVQACAEFGAELAVRLRALPGGPAP